MLAANQPEVGNDFLQLKNLCAHHRRYLSVSRLIPYLVDPIYVPPVCRHEASASNRRAMLNYITGFASGHWLKSRQPSALYNQALADCIFGIIGTDTFKPDKTLLSGKAHCKIFPILDFISAVFQFVIKLTQRHDARICKNLLNILFQE